MRITDRVIEGMQSWWARPLEKVYAAIGVDLDGHKDIQGMWAGDRDGESVKYWLAVLTELKNRGVRDVFFVGIRGSSQSRV